MSTARLLLLLVGLVVMPAVAGADTIVADNLIYSPFQYSHYRTDIGYEDMDRGFANTGTAQPFVSQASGPLKSIASLISVRNGGEPLQVAIHEKTTSGVGAKLGTVDFPQSLFPSDYMKYPPTVLDMTGSGVTLVAGESYFIVLTTRTSVHDSRRYSVHIMPPTPKSLGTTYWHTRNGVTFYASSLGKGYELPITVTVVPEPATPLLLIVAGTLVGSRFLTARGRRRVCSPISASPQG